MKLLRFSALTTMNQPRFHSNSLLLLVATKLIQSWQAPKL